VPWDDQGQGSTAFCSLHVDFLICLPVCSLDLRRLEWLFLFVFPGLTERLKRYSPIWAVISFCYLCWLVGFCFDLRVWVGVEVDNYSNSRPKDNAHARARARVCVCLFRYGRQVERWRGHICTENIFLSQLPGTKLQAVWSSHQRASQDVRPGWLFL